MKVTFKAVAGVFLAAYLVVSLIPTHEYLHCAGYWVAGGVDDCRVNFYNDLDRHDGVRLGNADEGTDFDHAWIWPVGLLAFAAVWVIMREPRSRSHQAAPKVSATSRRASALQTRRQKAKPSDDQVGKEA